MHQIGIWPTYSANGQESLWIVEELGVGGGGRFSCTAKWQDSVLAILTANLWTETDCTQVA